MCVLMSSTLLVYLMVVVMALKAQKIQVCPKRCICQLRLGDNFITGSVTPHAFNDLENLRALHLDSNRLQKLKRLDVTSNKLHKLPPDPVFQRAGVLATSGVLGPSS
uniref:Leucine rich repeat and fibronectin type III domain containing 5b n=1 Tax=Cyprinus carpio TaxID=7962 RepID=A0A8C2GXK2_CYPCA